MKMKLDDFYKETDIQGARIDELSNQWLEAEKECENAAKEVKHWAEVKAAKAKLIYLEANAKYIDFLKNVEFDI